jgi:hypothetical protein
MCRTTVESPARNGDCRAGRRQRGLPAVKSGGRSLVTGCGSAGAAGAPDAGFCEDRGGNAEFAKGGVGDALAGCVVGCDLHERLLQTVEVWLVLLGREPGFEIEPALDEFEPGDRVVLGRFAPGAVRAWSRVGGRRVGGSRGR